MQETNTLTIEKIGTITIPGAVPSINEYIKAMQKHRLQGASFEQRWKNVGKGRAKDWIAENLPDDFCPLGEGVWVSIKVYRANNIRRDIHNLFIKPIFDGFTDAGLWRDDNEKVVPKVAFEYCGVDKENPRVEFEIYQEVNLAESGS